MKEALFFPWPGVTAQPPLGSGLLYLTLKLLKQQWVHKAQSPRTTLIFLIYFTNYSFSAVHSCFRMPKRDRVLLENKIFLGVFLGSLK